MYQAIYKCRLCGEEFVENETKKGKVQTINIPFLINEDIRQVKFPINIFENTTHYCEDGSVGFSEFQGFKKVED